MWLRHITGTARLIVKFLAAGLLGVFITVLVVFVYVLDSRPDLSVWHLADLDEEFTAKSDVSDFKAYLALEDRLFQQLDDLVYAAGFRSTGTEASSCARTSRRRACCFCTACRTRPTACAHWPSYCTSTVPGWLACGFPATERRPPAW